MGECSSRETSVVIRPCILSAEENAAAREHLLSLSSDVGLQVPRFLFVNKTFHPCRVEVCRDAEPGVRLYICNLEAEGTSHRTPFVPKDANGGWTVRFVSGESSDTPDNLHIVDELQGVSCSAGGACVTLELVAGGAEMARVDYLRSAMKEVGNTLDERLQVDPGEGAIKMHIRLLDNTAIYRDVKADFTIGDVRAILEHGHPG